MDPNKNRSSLLEAGEIPDKGILIWLSLDSFNEVVERLGVNQVQLDKAHSSTNGLADIWGFLDGYRIVMSSLFECPIVEK